MKPWSIKDSMELYNVSHWSSGFFSINDKGRVIALPDRENSIDLTELSVALKQQGIPYPCLVRFPNILHSRIEKITNSFQQAIEHYEYQAEYAIVYPIKVNQQRRVVEEIAACELDNPSKVGLEAGSKPELMAILGVSEKPLTIVCNGYKDSEFLRLACIGQALGHKVHVVIEKMTEDIYSMILKETPEFK